MKHDKFEIEFSNCQVFGEVRNFLISVISINLLNLSFQFISFTREILINFIDISRFHDK